MKFTVDYTDENDGTKKTLHFLRTLGTEKAYRDALSTTDEVVEFTKDLTAILLTYQDFSASSDKSPKDRTPEDREIVERVLSLQFKEMAHNILRFAFAEVKDGKLVQNESTREDYENLDGVPETEVLTAFFRKVLGA